MEKQVVVIASRRGVLERLHLGYDDLRKVVRLLSDNRTKAEAVMIIYWEWVRST